MPRRSHREDLGLAPKPDLDPLFTDVECFRSARREVLIRRVGCQPLYEQVLHVRLRGRQAPCDIRIVTEQDERHAGHGGAGDLEVGRNDARQIP